MGGVGGVCFWFIGGWLRAYDGGMDTNTGNLLVYALRGFRLHKSYVDSGAHHAPSPLSAPTRLAVGPPRLTAPCSAPCTGPSAVLRQAAEMKRCGGRGDANRGCANHPRKTAPGPAKPTCAAMTPLAGSMRAAGQRANQAARHAANPPPSKKRSG